MSSTHPPLLLPSTDATGNSPLITTFATTTTVQFDDLEQEAIEEYIKTGEPFGKAGSYGIQVQ